MVRAFYKDKWEVATTPRRIKRGKRTIHIDIEAWRNINGKLRQVLLAEIKCFASRSRTTRELYAAIGQYIIYRTILAELNMTIPLYLAIPKTVYDTVFDMSVRRAMSDNNIKLVIVDLEAEVITQWIE
jgi:hypothetical protein